MGHTLLMISLPMQRTSSTYILTGKGTLEKIINITADNSLSVAKTERQRSKKDNRFHNGEEQYHNDNI